MDKKDFMKMMLGMALSDSEDKEKFMNEIQQAAHKGLSELMDSIVWKDDLTVEEQQVRSAVDAAVPIVLNMASTTRQERRAKGESMTIKQIEATMKFESAITDVFQAGIDYCKIFGILTIKEKENKE